MSEENVEALRRAAEAVKNKDPSILDVLLDPEVVWNTKMTAPDLVGNYRGIDEVRKWFGRWEQAWEEWDWTLPEMRAYGDTVIARMHLWARGRGSGIEIESDVWQAWTFRGSRVVYFQDFETRAQALGAAGISE